jgi:hypothetical protein
MLNSALFKCPMPVAPMGRIFVDQLSVAVDIFEQKIWDITVLIGKENNKSNLNKSGVLTNCPPGKRIGIDGGFTGDADKLFGYNQFDLYIMKWVKKRVKSRVESYNKRMNDYECMKGIFRHGDEWFNDCAVAVVILTQYQIEDTNPESVEPLFVL